MTVLLLVHVARVWMGFKITAAFIYIMTAVSSSFTNDEADSLIISSSFHKESREKIYDQTMTTRCIASAHCVVILHQRPEHCHTVGAAIHLSNALKLKYETKTQ
jgi:hypothetical protein